MKSFLTLLLLQLSSLLLAQAITEPGCQYGNCFTGTGQFNYEDGSMYVGRFREGYKHGKGKFTDPEGNTYNGNWKYDKRHGVGESQNLEGEIYKGEWVYDFREGKGTLTYPNKEKYIGNFIKGYREGKGIYYWLDGTYYEGYWNNDVIEGIGSIYYTDKSRYEGEWKNGEADGYGVLYNKNGEVEKIGKWAIGDFVKSIDAGDVYRALFRKQQYQGIDEFTVGEIFQKDAPAVFTILSQDADSNIVKGAGIFLSEDGVALCPYNLLTGYQTGREVIVALDTIHAIDSLIYKNEILNFAIIKINIDSLAPTVEVTKTAPQNMQKIFIVGPTITFQNTIDDGLIKTVTTESLIEIEYDAQTKVSNGSAVFNEAGELIGMTVIHPSMPGKKIVLNLHTIEIPGLETISEEKKD